VRRNWSPGYTLLREGCPLAWINAIYSSMKMTQCKFSSDKAVTVAFQIKLEIRNVNQIMRPRWTLSLSLWGDQLPLCRPCFLSKQETAIFLPRILCGPTDDGLECTLKPVYFSWTLRGHILLCRFPILTRNHLYRSKSSFLTNYLRLIFSLTLKKIRMAQFQTYTL